jgi:hypothetical protein
MPELELTSEDQEIVDLLRRNWRDEIDPLKKQVAALMQRTSRPPGVGLEHAALGFAPAALSRQLNDDTGFQGAG